MSTSQQWHPSQLPVDPLELARLASLLTAQATEWTAELLRIVNARGQPRGLLWIDCQPISEPVLGREIPTGIVTALVAVNVRFTAIAGGEMEDLPQVDLVRTGTLVLKYVDGRWNPTGRVFFNLLPEKLSGQLAGTWERLQCLVSGDE